MRASARDTRRASPSAGASATGQLALDLPGRAPSHDLADFVIGAPNAEALAWIDRWPDGWPDRALLLVGPAGSGKSHLGAIWAARVAALTVPCAKSEELEAAAEAALTGRSVLVEGLDRLQGRPRLEQALFHLINAVRQGGGGVLGTARTTPLEWALALDDLASRLRGMALVRLGPPDEALLTGVLMKQFADRQMAVGQAVLHSLTLHLDRSFDAAAAVVARLDRATWPNRKVTRALALDAVAALAAERQTALPGVGPGIAPGPGPGPGAGIAPGDTSDTQDMRNGG